MSLLHSVVFDDGVEAFPDWLAAAEDEDLASCEILTARLGADSLAVGFAVLHFGDEELQREGLGATLQAFTAAVARAIFVFRAFAADPLNLPAGVRRRGSALQPTAAGPEADLLYAELDAALPVAVGAIANWELDPWELSDETVKAYLVLMLHAEGLLKPLKILPAEARAFVDSVAEHYVNTPFHNFRHAFTARPRQSPRRVGPAKSPEVGLW